MQINVLGTMYNVFLKEEKEDEKLKTRFGYCDTSAKEIVVCRLERDETSQKNLQSCMKETLRHEINHAFLYESGEFERYKDEWLMDFLAIQGPKMAKVWEEVEQFDLPEVQM